MTEKIDSFSGKYWFLSNFYPGDRTSLEHMYQAAKCADPDEREEILRCDTPGQAKRKGMRVRLRENWDNIKFDVMLGLVREKFKDPALRRKLIATGDADLIEDNTWKDTYWGVCNGVGENKLGIILKLVRGSIIHEQEKEMKAK